MRWGGLEAAFEASWEVIMYVFNVIKRYEDPILGGRSSEVQAEGGGMRAFLLILLVAVALLAIRAMAQAIEPFAIFIRSILSAVGVIVLVVVLAALAVTIAVGYA